MRIIVADDGSQGRKPPVVDLSAAEQVSGWHSWQPDRGFRAAESRNRALAQAKAIILC